MKFIVPVAVIAIMLLQFSGAVPQSSVGGPMTLAAVFLSASLAVGIHEAWTNKRSILGWIISIVVALIGGFLVANCGDLFAIAIITILSPLGWALDGSLAGTGGPLLYLSLAGMMLLILLGSWGALRIVSRWR